MKKSEYNNHFEVPNHYFENQKNALNHKIGVNFQVPDDYFENQKRVLLKSNNLNKNPWYKNEFVKMAAIFCIVATLTLLGYNKTFQMEDTPTIMTDATTSAESILVEIYNEPIEEEIEDLDVVESYFGELILAQNTTDGQESRVEPEKHNENSRKVEKVIEKKEASLEEASGVLFETYFEDEIGEEEYQDLEEDYLTL